MQGVMALSLMHGIAGPLAAAGETEGVLLSQLVQLLHSRPRCHCTFMNLGICYFATNQNISTDKENKKKTKWTHKDHKNETNHL